MAFNSSSGLRFPRQQIYFARRPSRFSPDARRSFLLYNASNYALLPPHSALLSKQGTCIRFSVQEGAMAANPLIERISGQLVSFAF